MEKKVKYPVGWKSFGDSSIDNWELADTMVRECKRIIKVDVGFLVKD